MLNLRFSFVAPRLLQLILPLGGLCLLGAGCTTTKQVPSNTPSARSRVTVAAQGKTAHLHLTEGRTLELTQLYVGPQTTSGRTPTGTKRTIPTAALQKIVFIDRGIGFLQGAGLAGGPVLTVGLVRSMMEENELAQFVGVVGSVAVAVPSALVRGLLGMIEGHRETY
jgi:hypothetical protein